MAALEYLEKFKQEQSQPKLAAAKLRPTPSSSANLFEGGILSNGSNKAPVQNPYLA